MSLSENPRWKMCFSATRDRIIHMSNIEISQIKVIAAKEFRDRIRNRWVIAVAFIFTAFALAIAYFGSAQQGEVGLRNIEVTIASLVSLVIYLIPLIALIPVSYTHLRAHE